MPGSLAVRTIGEADNTGLLHIHGFHGDFRFAHKIIKGIARDRIAAEVDAYGRLEPIHRRQARQAMDE